MGHLRQNRAWFSETVRAYLGIQDTYASDHYEIMHDLVHPGHPAQAAGFIVYQAAKFLNDFWKRLSFN